MIYASCVSVMCILSQTKINFANFPVNLWVASFMVYAFHLRVYPELHVFTKTFIIDNSFFFFCTNLMPCNHM